MKVNVDYSINDDMSLGWTVTISKNLPAGDTNFVYVFNLSDGH